MGENGSTPRKTGLEPTPDSGESYCLCRIRREVIGLYIKIKNKSRNSLMLTTDPIKMNMILRQEHVIIFLFGLPSRHVGNIVI